MSADKDDKSKAIIHIRGVSRGEPLKLADCYIRGEYIWGSLSFGVTCERRPRGCTFGLVVYAQSYQHISQVGDATKEVNEDRVSFDK